MGSPEGTLRPRGQPATQTRVSASGFLLSVPLSPTYPPQGSLLQVEAGHLSFLGSQSPTVTPSYIVDISSATK